MEDNTAQDLLTAEMQALTGAGVIPRFTGEIDMSSVHVLSEQLESAANAGCSRDDPSWPESRSNVWDM